MVNKPPNLGYLPTPRPIQERSVSRTHGAVKAKKLPAQPASLIADWEALRREGAQDRIRKETVGRESLHIAIRLCRSFPKIFHIVNVRPPDNTHNISRWLRDTYESACRGMDVKRSELGYYRDRVSETNVFDEDLIFTNKFWRGLVHMTENAIANEQSFVDWLYGLFVG